MSAILVLVLVALWATLLAWAITALISDSNTTRSHVSRRSTAHPPARQSAGRSPRPNPLFWFAGVLAVGVGLLATIDGVENLARGMDHPDPFGSKGAEALADAASMVSWGFVTITVGVYAWRGARRRGWRDRLGRIVLVIGYLVLGVALSQMIHTSVDIWAAESHREGEDVLVDAMVQFLGWGGPAALLVFVGTRLANEKILMTANASVSF